MPVVITAQNFRLKNWTDSLGVFNIGGGQAGSAEPSFPYVSPNAYNRKVTSSAGAGYYYDPTADGKAQVDMTNVQFDTFLAKVIVTDAGGLQTSNGDRVRIGSGTNDYYEYVLAGSLSPVDFYKKYPSKLGYIIVPISPSIPFFRTGTVGSPDLQFVDYIGHLASFVASQAKSENVGISALDFSVGLTITGGDVVEPAIHKDLSDWGEDDDTQRQGSVGRLGNSVYYFGTIIFGNASNPIYFDDNTYSAVVPDNFAKVGYNNFQFSLENASSFIRLSKPFTSQGSRTGSDTRADITFIGIDGTGIIRTALENMRNITLTEAVNTESGAVLGCELLIQSNANLNNAIINTASLTNVATLQDPDFSKLTGATFIQNGTGHGIQSNLNGVSVNIECDSVGYGVDDSSDAFFVYLGIDPIDLTYTGNRPTVKPTSLVNVIDNVNTFSFNINPAITNYEWRIYQVPQLGSLEGSVELTGEENAVLSLQTYAYNYVSDIFIAVQILTQPNKDYIELIEYFTLSNLNQNVNLNLRIDNNN